MFRVHANFFDILSREFYVKCSVRICDIAVYYIFFHAIFINIFLDAFSFISIIFFLIGM